MDAIKTRVLPLTTGADNVPTAASEAECRRLFDEALKARNGHLTRAREHVHAHAYERGPHLLLRDASKRQAERGSLQFWS